MCISYNEAQTLFAVVYTKISLNRLWFVNISATWDACIKYVFSHFGDLLAEVLQTWHRISMKGILSFFRERHLFKGVGDLKVRFAGISTSQRRQFPAWSKTVHQQRSFGKVKIHSIFSPCWNFVPMNVAKIKILRLNKFSCVRSM